MKRNIFIKVYCSGLFQPLKIICHTIQITDTWSLKCINVKFQ